MFDISIMSKIIGYIHVCQMPGWERSFDILWKSITQSGLYDATEEIRVGILNSTGRVIPNERLVNDKINIVYVGVCNEYERPTLLHMRKRAEYETCNYWYLHTKGLRHFGTDKERSVKNWIDIMLYWNITKWRGANKILENYDTYGCLCIELSPNKYHYSGNFWWATSKHIQTLPDKIAKFYIAPENWILERIKTNFFSAYNHQFNSNYFINIPEKDYKLEITSNSVQDINHKLIDIMKPIKLECPPNFNMHDGLFNNTLAPKKKIIGIKDFFLAKLRK